MSDTLYRRNQDGMMESVVPEAQGKAAAHDRLMAQGGKTNKQGKFTQGRLKGLTYDQAKQKFEGMWASAPEQLKEGYAEHARSGATASERKVAEDKKTALDARIDRERGIRSIQPTPQSQTMVAPPVSRQMAATPAPGNSFSDLTKQPITPAGGAQSVGDGSSAANGYTPQPRTVYNMRTGQQDPVVMSATPAMSPAQMDAVDTKRALDQYAASPLAPKPLPQDNSTPIGRMASSAYQGASDMVDSAARAISKPLVSDATYAAGSRSIDDGRATRAAQELAANQARQKRVNGILGVTPPAIAATPAPQVPSTTTPSPQARPFVGPPAPQMSATPAPESRMNPLTGLPMGYRSGDSVSPQYQGKADESVARQKSAQDAAIASAPRAVPVASPNALADQHTAAVASYKQDLDPAKAVKADAIYAGGTDQQKAQMVGNTLKRAAGVTAATRPQYARR